MVVQALQAMGIQVWMVTGDSRGTGRAIAQELGIPIENVIAETTPPEKATFVSAIQDQAVKEGKGRQVTVTFVGDGVNDAVALAKANVGVAIGSGTDVAVQTASVVLIRSELTDVVTAIDLSRHTLARIRTNFRFAMVYNLICIPVAAGAAYPLMHVALHPMAAGAAMALSSVSVVISSLWLKRYVRPDLPKVIAQARHTVSQDNSSLSGILSSFMASRVPDVTIRLPSSSSSSTSTVVPAGASSSGASNSPQIAPNSPDLSPTERLQAVWKKRFGGRRKDGVRYAELPTNLEQESDGEEGGDADDEFELELEIPDDDDENENENEQTTMAARLTKPSQYQAIRSQTDGPAS
eukprot:TRINITY_DN952_c0_g1_i7.p1 TRINITY_DN952_c0_g1~~TRINITY_DN952_c0_g1_i7.p1  ORF type:complete len:405 (-),score=144.34 TRINITY_DN952_c0_g1_i7:155-1210(-)